MGRQDARGYWTWTTRPEYYYDEPGVPADHLNPSLNPGGSGWWTCHKNTKSGDLAMLYRSAPESNVAYMFEATSGARLLGDDLDEGQFTVPRFAELVRQADDLSSNSEGSVDRSGSYLAEWSDLLRLGEEVDRLWADQESDSWDPELDDELYQRDELYGETRDNLAAGVFTTLGMPVLDTVVIIDESETKFGPDTYVCDWRPRYMFKNPLELADLKADPWLAKNWNALRANFIRSAYRTSPEVWTYLIDKAASAGNRDLKSTLKSLGSAGPSSDIRSERHLEDRLAAAPDLIPGIDLELIHEGSMGIGRQVKAGRGWIDLLGRDRVTGRYVVVELKAVRATREVVGQVVAYVGWVTEHLSNGSPVDGVVISDGVDSHFRYGAAAIPNLRHIDIADLGL